MFKYMQVAIPPARLLLQALVYEASVARVMHASVYRNRCVCVVNSAWSRVPQPDYIHAADDASALLLCPVLSLLDLTDY